MQLTVHCQCDHVTTPNPKSSVLNFTRSHLVTLVMVEYFKEAHSDDPVSFTAIGIDHVPLTSRREDRQRTINQKELLDPSGLGCGVTWSECCYRQLFFCADSIFVFSRVCITYVDYCPYWPNIWIMPFLIGLMLLVVIVSFAAINFDLALSKPLTDDYSFERAAEFIICMPGWFKMVLIFFL